MLTGGHVRSQVVDTCIDYSSSISPQTELVLFYGPGCGFCENAKYGLASLKNNFVDLDVSFVNVTPFKESVFDLDSIASYSTCYDAMSILSSNKMVPQVYLYDGGRQKFTRVSKGWSKKSLSRIRERLLRVFD
jgi:hypothetical protein